MPVTVVNQRSPLREKIEYISPDGVVYNFHDPYKRAWISTAGWGMVPMQYASTHGPFQQGDSILSGRAVPRTIEVSIRGNGCSRSEYWSNRAGLLNSLRPNRTNLNAPSPGKLRWRRADGQTRQVDVFITEGPNLPPPGSGVWDEFGFSDTIVFTAFNPILYNPTQLNEAFFGFDCQALQQLQFPFVFQDPSGLLFSGDTCDASGQITIPYTGTWEEYPLIVLQGPAERIIIEHNQLGSIIDLTYDITESQTITIDLSYGSKTIYTSTGENLLGYLASTTDLSTFSIQPDPIVAGGNNTFDITIVRGTAATSVTIYYYLRYAGM